MAVYLIESKADQQKLIDYVGEDTAKLFFSLKDRLKSPENDIYYWLKRDPSLLRDRLDDLQNTQTRSQKDEEASKGAELIYNKDGWKVYHITTYEASQKYGKNTQWCITGSKRWSNGERGEEYFNNYTSKGVEFYFYIKDGNEKYALAYTPQNGNYQVFNAKDEDISNSDLSFLPNVEGLPHLNLNDLVSEDGTFIFNNSTLSVVAKLRGIKEKVKHLIVSDEITSIPDYAFNYSNIETIEFPNSLRYIGESAFACCNKLTEVYLPDSITVLYRRCFSSCQNLKKINIPQNEDLNIIPSEMLYYTDIEELILPENIKEIGPNAFLGTKIKHLTLSEGMKTIRAEAFRGMRSLESIDIPSTIYVIHEGAFRECTQLKSMDLSHTRVSTIDNRAFENCYYLGQIILPSGLFDIEEQAFTNCESLTSINIPSSVEAIGVRAFKNCYGLREVYLENTSIDTLGYEVFKGCTLSNLTVYLSGPQSDFVEASLLAEYDGKINVQRV